MIQTQFPFDTVPTTTGGNTAFSIISFCLVVGLTIVIIRFNSKREQDEKS
jgi:hypothetical protein